MSKIESLPSLAPVKHKTKRELAYQELRKGFITGQFVPGDTLTVALLASSLGLGLMPVREAAQQLASQGAFDFLPNRSLRVPIPSMKELEDIFDTRLLIECHATSQAARRIEASQVSELRRVLNSLAAAVKRVDVAQICNLNARFHFGIYDQCDNVFAIDMIQRIWLRTGPFHAAIWRESKEARAEIEKVIPWHYDLVDALEANSSAVSKKIIRKMILASRSWQLHHLEVYD